MLTPASATEYTTKSEKDVKEALAAKISDEIWTALQNGFQWLFANISSTEICKTRSVQLPTSFAPTVEAKTKNITGSIQIPHAHVSNDSSTENDRRSIQSWHMITGTDSTPEPTSDKALTDFIQNSHALISNYSSSESDSTSIQSNFVNKISTADSVNTTSPTLYPYFPAYYNLNECSLLNSTSDKISGCEKPGAVFAFGSFVFLLGVAAIVGNCVLPILVWRRRKMRTRQNFIKVSLAFNDMIAGCILLFSVLPNVFWFRNSSESEVIEGMNKTANSAMAIVAGSSLIIALQGSLFHLMFLSADRFVAIKWPMWNRYRRNSTTVRTLVGIWILTITVSAITAAFPDYFKYAYNPLVFMYTLGYNKEAKSLLHGMLHFGFVLLFPYLATIVLTLLTGAVAFKELKIFSTSKRNYLYTGATSRTNTPNSSQRATDNKSDKGKKPELAVVKTIMIMTGSFVLAWSLFFMIFFLSNRVFKHGEKITSVIYMVSFYSGLSNSVANVIIYSLRDSRFRQAVYATFTGRESFETRQ